MSRSYVTDCFRPGENSLQIKFILICQSRLPICCSRLEVKGRHRPRVELRQLLGSILLSILILLRNLLQNLLFFFQDLFHLFLKGFVLSFSWSSLILRHSKVLSFIFQTRAEQRKSCQWSRHLLAQSPTDETTLFCTCIASLH